MRLRFYVRDRRLYCRDCGSQVPWRRLIFHEVDSCPVCEGFTLWFLFGGKR